MASLPLGESLHSCNYRYPLSLSSFPSSSPFPFSPPHQTLCSAFLAFGTEALGFPRLFPGLDLRVLTLRINFLAPLLREYLLLLGTCDVSARTCRHILGRGKSVLIAVGGAAEVRG